MRAPPQSSASRQVKVGMFTILIVGGTIMMTLYHPTIEYTEYTRYPPVLELNTIACGNATSLPSSNSVTTPKAQLDETTIYLTEQSTQHVMNTVNPIFRHSIIELYKPVIEPKDICLTNASMVIVVISAPAAFSHRRIYRNTVLSPLKSMNGAVQVFVMGQSTEETNQQLLEESQRYGDIIQGSYVDSYENNTLKGLFWVHWAATRCPHSKFVLKMDDDVFANIDQVQLYIKSLDEVKRAVVGVIFHQARPIYDKSNKWYVENYYKPFYPDYASGPAYVLTTDILDQIFNCSISTPFLRMEDILITGICASPDVRHINAPHFYYATQPVGQIDPKVALAMHSYTTEQIVQLWNTAHPNTPFDLSAAKESV